MIPSLGVCYYPEHWDEALWAEDAARMVEAGLTYVRIGEFAWSRLEPSEGQFTWDWLDRAVQTLRSAGLKIVMGTPSATPPRWMIDKHPDMLIVGPDGRALGHGGRRHYCFSHAGYRAEAARIAGQMAERYSDAVEIWQTDNEYGCHDTTLSYSQNARSAFQDWLAARYGSGNSGIQALNAAWGNVFWSMDYDNFAQIDLPNAVVAEANPAHSLAFRRFSSDQVVAFNRAITDAIRAHSNAPILHNYMGRITDFDHFDVGADLDAASWDSYPLGFLEDRIDATEPHRAAFARQGDPDFQAFHHDLYRAVGKGRFWVMEQQPGPVNWAPWNPAPLPGMVRLWSLEALAHGAEVVSYFRWRQAPFAQEQMHAGLLRPDSSAAPGLTEATQTAADIKAIGALETKPANIALVFDYPSQWMCEIQRQGQDFDTFTLAFETYTALRKLGLSIDIVAPTADLSAYQLVMLPGILHLPDALKTTLKTHPGTIVALPRTGSKTAEFSIPSTLAPEAFDITITEVESLRPGLTIPLPTGNFTRWFEHATGPILAQTSDNRPAILGTPTRQYIAGWPDPTAMTQMLKTICENLDLETLTLADGLRRRHCGDRVFWFNYANTPATLPNGEILAPAGVTWD